MTPEQLSKFVSELGYPIAIGVVLIGGVIYMMRRWLDMIDLQYQDHRKDLHKFIDTIDKISVNYQNFTLKAEQNNHEIKQSMEEIYKQVHIMDNKLDLTDSKLDIIKNIIKGKRKYYEETSQNNY